SREAHRELRAIAAGTAGASLPAGLRPGAQSRRVRVEPLEARGSEQEAAAPGRVAARPGPGGSRADPTHASLGAVVLSRPECSLCYILISMIAKGITALLRIAVAASLLAGFAVSGPDPALAGSPAEGLVIKVLSNRADLISGGDALVEILLPRKALAE